MSDLQKLISRRNALLAQINVELSVADNIKERNPSQSEVRDRLNQLNELAASFRETQSSIEEKQEDPVATASVHSVREEFFGMFYRVKNIFESHLDEVGSSVSQQTVANTADWKEALHLLIETQRKLLLDQAMTAKTVENLSMFPIAAIKLSDGEQVSNGAPQLNVRLPAIQIQPFNGEPSPQSLSRLITTSDEIVQQLDALGQEFKSRDPWLIHLILEKLDKDTRASWSQEVVEIENPTFEELLAFLKKRCEMIETCSAFVKKPVNEPKKEVQRSVPISTKLKTLYTSTTDKKCAKCSSEHNTYRCEEFKNMSVKDRRELVQKAKLCFNCLRPFHSVKSCTSKSVCHNSDCKQQHHTLLCPVVKKAEQPEAEQQEDSAVAPAKEESAIVSLAAEVPENKQKSIPLLPTAVVKVQKVDGDFMTARVLIDSGSQASLVTESCVRKLQLPRRNGKLVVNGLGQQEVGTTRGVVTLRLASRFKDTLVLSIEAYVLGKLTTIIPSQPFDVDNMIDNSKPALGDSLAVAKKRLKCIERRFHLDPEFKNQYTNFMREYLELGHMEEVPVAEV
ncbi:uncharacterized protein LOC135697110 [Ochlerotatus camptorhynchus]|uniref:uncharacterized protein LOC135697110 n=1 Tax=Ochlerotatus camptorhynchus TaxID=644619 RepID=UPI0031DF3482